MPTFDMGKAINSAVRASGELSDERRSNAQAAINAFLAAVAKQGFVLADINYVDRGASIKQELQAMTAERDELQRNAHRLADDFHIARQQLVAANNEIARLNKRSSELAENARRQSELASPEVERLNVRLKTLEKDRDEWKSVATIVGSGLSASTDQSAKLKATIQNQAEEIADLRRIRDAAIKAFPLSDVIGELRSPVINLIDALEQSASKDAG